MFVKKLLIVLAVLYSPVALRAQLNACTTLGQTPATAFPVCGSDTFVQTSVPVCVNGTVPVRCSNSSDLNVYQDLNPFWYKFTCFTAGTLGLTIVPNNLLDDYDWQLFDVTGQNPGDVYTNPKLVIGSNWSGLVGITGTSSSAMSLFECGSTSIPATGPPIFSSMPSLIKGHNYLLLISHFSGDSQSGYKLTFLGGTASITDTTAPAISAARTSCDGTQIIVLLNKRMQCGSLTSGGSEFTLSPGPNSIVSASASGCSSGFDMDSVTLTLSGILAPGNYTLTAMNGTDGNTLLDNCNAQIPVGSSVSFNKAAVPQPTPLDSLTPPGCAPQVIQLVFSKGILCSSLAADGSDFTITGPSPVSVSGVTGICDGNDETGIVLLHLSAPIVTGGLYKITLVTGTDGNTIIDECGQTTPAGSSLTFLTKDTVSAALFNDQIVDGCKKDTLMLSYPPANGVDQWQWVFNSSDTSLLQDPQRSFSNISQNSIQLIVSNGVCSDTLLTSVTLGNGVHSDFEGPNLLCPKDAAEFKNNSSGPIVSWNWEFGDGAGSAFQLPSGHLYPQTGIETKYNVTLIVGNSMGCTDTAVQVLDILKSCFIAVPSAFTPNGDGLNDYLYPLNAYNADNLEFMVFNRYGQLVFETRDWTKKWDGTAGGHPQPAGTFVWTLRYTDRETGKKFFSKGVTILIR